MKVKMGAMPTTPRTRPSGVGRSGLMPFTGILPAPTYPTTTIEDRVDKLIVLTIALALKTNQPPDYRLSPA